MKKFLIYIVTLLSYSFVFSATKAVITDNFLTNIKRHQQTMQEQFKSAYFTYPKESWSDKLDYQHATLQCTTYNQETIKLYLGDIHPNQDPETIDLTKLQTSVKDKRDSFGEGLEQYKVSILAILPSIIKKISSITNAND